MTEQNSVHSPLLTVYDMKDERTVNLMAFYYTMQPKVRAPFFPDEMQGSLAVCRYRQIAISQSTLAPPALNFQQDEVASKDKYLVAGKVHCTA
jgi:hypothetical protein